MTLPTDPVERAIACAALAVGLETPDDMFKGRSKLRSRARHVAIRLVRERTDLSFRQIARRLGYFDHSSLVDSINNVNQDEAGWQEQIINALLLYDGKAPLRRAPTVKDVNDAVTREWGNSHGAGPMRAALCREILGMSYPEIARRRGKDHTTVMYAVKKAEHFEATDPDFRDAINRARARLRALAW